MIFFQVIQIFLSFAEIPKNQRSKIDRILLVAVVKEKVVKRFGFKKVYNRIVEDLLKLESGVTIHKPVRRLVKGGLLLHPADNLEAHSVGGFSQSFSSSDVCRFCHIKYDDLQENIHNYGSKQHCRWTKDEYVRAADIAEARMRDQNESDDSMDVGEASNMEHDMNSDSDTSDGEDNDEVTEDDENEGPEELFCVKHKCPLNILQAFHCTSGFPPDILSHKFIISEVLWSPITLSPPLLLSSRASLFPLSDNTVCVEVDVIFFW